MKRKLIFILMLMLLLILLTASKPNKPITTIYDANSEELTREASLLFQQIAAIYEIDWRLLASLAYHESNLDPAAIGGNGEYGLMQIHPDTWDEIAPGLGLSDPFDPYSNIVAGTAYLASLRYYNSLGHDKEYWFIVAYNWGPYNTAQFLQNGGSWNELPYQIQKYVFDIFEEVNQPLSILWTDLLKQPVYP